MVRNTLVNFILLFTLFVLGIAKSQAQNASVCLDDNNFLEFKDSKIIGSENVIWVAGFNDGAWIWENNLSCSPGVCKSQLSYTGGEIQFRLEGPGIQGYYSPVGGIESFNPTVIPFSCSASVTTIEAEQGRLSGSAQIYQDQDASNDQGVAYLSTAGASVELNSVPASSSLVLNYTSQLSGSISLFVNGVDTADISFESTGSWLGNYARANSDLSIPENSVVKIVYDSGDAALNLDSIDFVSESQAPAENPYKVRIVYHIPADDEQRADYKALMEESIANAQTWLLEQVGKTFTFADNGQATVAKSTRPEVSFQVPEIWEEIHDDVIDILGPGSNFESRVIFSSVDAVPLPDGGCISAGAANIRVVVVSGDDLRGLAQEGTLCPHFGEFDIGRWYGGQLHELLHTFTLPHPKNGTVPTPGYEGECQDDQCIMQFGWITFPETYLTPTDVYTLDRSPFLGREFGQTYTIENTNSGMCADIRFVSTIMTTPIIQFFCFSDSTNFQWQITPVGDFVQIENNLSLSCINVANEGVANGETLEIFRCDGRDTSLWDMQEQADGTVVFQNKLSGLCMAIENDSIDGLATAIQGNCASPSAKWKLNPIEL